MPQSEFDIIARYFTPQRVTRRDVALGIGDDAALIAVPEDTQLAVAIDTLVSGVHFPVETAAEDIGYKALAVNLSDLAAMGAEPAWFTLALTLPEAERDWLDGFARGLFSLAETHHLQLVGGDTSRGPLTVSIQVAGYVPPQAALTRRGAQVGDAVYVSGRLGEAALGLACLQQADEYEYDASAIRKLNRPEPRVTLGLALREIATACIDISDGLLADLAHILTASQVGAAINVQRLPLSERLHALCVSDKRYYQLALSGGDDYELCFCVPPDQEGRLAAIAAAQGISLTRIGQLESEPGIQLRIGDQAYPHDAPGGFEHFRG